MGWNYLSIPKLPVEVWEWIINFTPYCYQACNHLSILELKLNPVSKRGPRLGFQYRSNTKLSEIFLKDPGAWWHICAMMQWISSGSGEARHLSAPSHYLNQCWLIIKRVLRNKLQWNFNKIKRTCFHKMYLKILFVKYHLVSVSQNCKCGWGFNWQ